MTNTNRTTNRSTKRMGFSLMEVVVSTLVVTLVLIGAMNCVTDSMRSRDSLSRQVRAELLAQDLLTEILSRPYEDNTSPTFGPESGEPSIFADRTRSTFDDVDDYWGWSASPPEDIDGLALDGVGSEWRRSVQVSFVKRDDPNALLYFSTEDMKKLVVHVFYKGKLVASCASLRSKAYSEVESADAVTSPAASGGSGGAASASLKLKL